MKSFLEFLFNICFENGVLPTAWKASYVKTLYKGKGSKTDANSYRGISLLSCLYKIYTGIIYKRLQVWADEILPPSQFGFRKGKSTIDAAKHFATTFTCTSIVVAGNIMHAL